RDAEPARITPFCAGQAECRAFGARVVRVAFLREHVDARFEVAPSIAEDRNQVDEGLGMLAKHDVTHLVIPSIAKFYHEARTRFSESPLGDKRSYHWFDHAIATWRHAPPRAPRFGPIRRFVCPRAQDELR